MSQVVELTDDDLALAASVMRSHGKEMKHLAIHAQGDRCLRIAEDLCNARPLEDFLEAVKDVFEEHLTQLG